MSSRFFSMGCDFGSNSVRTIIIDVNTGEEFGVDTCTYPAGKSGVITDSSNPHIARQLPSAYLDALVTATTEAVKTAKTDSDFSVENIVGIGVDTTGSTPIPVTSDMTPLSELPEFKDNLNAMAWMWKDHSSMEEAEKITECAKKHRPQFLAKCGGTYSSEWFYSKLWHCLNVDEKVFNSAASWVEFTDFIPATICGVKSLDNLKCGICAAGHKAMYVKMIIQKFQN